MSREIELVLKNVICGEVQKDGLTILRCKPEGMLKKGQKLTLLRTLDKEGKPVAYGLTGLTREQAEALIKKGV